VKREAAERGESEASSQLSLALALRRCMAAEEEGTAAEAGAPLSNFLPTSFTSNCARWVRAARVRGGKACDGSGARACLVVEEDAHRRPPPARA
jgi:hypothetical protein